MRIIINADDCGYNEFVNEHIKAAINKGKVSSTTIMANMEGVDGAFALYEEFHNKVSFGVHLNITEGSPILKSKLLIDKGFYHVVDGEIFFDPIKAESYRFKTMPQNMRDEVYKEFRAQIEALIKGGVKISHIDSHHHIHTSVSMMGIVKQLSDDYGIKKIRRIRNYVPKSISYFGKKRRRANECQL